LCPTNAFVIGGEVRYVPQKGVFGDDSAV